MVLRIDGHAVIVSAARDRIPTDDRIRRRIDFGYLICASEVDIYPTSYRIVTGHSSFAVEFQGFDDHVFIHIHNCDCLAVGIRNVNLPERSSIGAPVWLLGGRQSLYDAHGVEI